MAKASPQKKSNANAAGLNFEAQLWAAADKMRDQRKNPKQDLADPPFKMSDWGGENLRQDTRWKFGMPPVNNTITHHA